LYKVSVKMRGVISYFFSRLAPGIIHALYKVKLFSLITPFYRLSQSGYLKVIKDKKLDLIFYLTSSDLSFLQDTPSVVAIHDVMHREHPQFPEVSAGGRWENREYGFTNICKHAYRVLVDSEVGKEDVVKYYHPDPDKVVVLQFLPPSYLESKMAFVKARKICDVLNLPKGFVFYPAKFWPHKNHKNLVKAIGILKRKGKQVNLVLTGSKDAEFSTYGATLRLIEKNDLEKHVFYLGYVDDKQISAIYKTARAMVMPTFFGPTNIPILEAWVMGTPAITSDIRGCRNQLGDAGLLINPSRPTDIADKVWKLYNNTALRQDLVRKGKIRLKNWTFGDFSARIRKIISEFELSKNAISKSN